MTCSSEYIYNFYVAHPLYFSVWHWTLWFTLIHNYSFGHYSDGILYVQVATWSHDRWPWGRRAGQLWDFSSSLHLIRIIWLVFSLPGQTPTTKCSRFNFQRKKIWEENHISVLIYATMNHAVFVQFCFVSSVIVERSV